MLPVHISELEGVGSAAIAPTPHSAGAINLEFPGGAPVTIEGSLHREFSAHRAGVPAALIELRTGTRVWIVAGVTDLRLSGVALSA